MNMALQTSVKPISTPALVSAPVQNGFQAKFSISAPNDEYEREADLAAEYVTAGVDISRLLSGTHNGLPAVQRDEERSFRAGAALAGIPIPENQRKTRERTAIERFNEFISNAEKYGLPVKFMKRVGKERAITIGSSSYYNYYLNFLSLKESDLASAEKMSPQLPLGESSAIRTIYEEGTHAYLDLAEDEKTIKPFIQVGEKHYEGALTTKGEKTSSPSRVFQEAAATYVGHRAARWWNAFEMLTIGVSSGNAKKEFYDDIKKDYDNAMAVLVFGYSEEGGVLGIGGKQTETTRPMSAQMKQFLDAELLEGKIPDRFEQNPGFMSLLSQAGINTIPEKESGGRQEEKIMPKSLDGDVKPVPQSVTSYPGSPGGGQPLTAPFRSFMESRFGFDFSKVRIHNDAKAAESARAVNALAYTVGHDIVFARDSYSPATAGGVRLLAHELAHTVQQSGASGLSNLRLSPTDDSHDLSGFRLQRKGGPPESSNEPLIPIPVFDELDPMIIVPDIEGIPRFLRGREVPLSTLRKALDALRGRLPAPSPGKDFCDTLLPGHETAPSGEFAGLCCPRFRRERELCCRPQDIGLMSFRCCTSDEVIVNGRCIQLRRAPVPVAPSLPRLPPIPRLELQMPRIRFGTVQSESIDHFTLNEASLPSGASEKLDRLASQLNLYREAEVHIDGHTDSSYTPEYNQRLSEQRAQTVRDALVKRGIDASRLIVTGYGENQLLFPQERTQEEKARNRRVDVWFYIPPSQSTGDMVLMRQPQTAAPLSSPSSPQEQGASPSTSAETTPVPELPVAAFVRFVTSGSVRCCRAAGPTGCPPHLGTAQPGDPRPKNGMNLVASITGHRRGIEYGFVQVIHMQRCVRYNASLGGGWGASGSRAPGSDDSPDPEATCLTPDARNEITMTDAPGYTIALGSAELSGGEEATQRMNATNWVIAREPRNPWKRISELFRWHSVTTIRRNAAGNWELTPRANRIGEGYTNVGGCPPP